MNTLTGTVASFVTFLSVALKVGEQYSSAVLRLSELFRWYGFTGIILYAFGSRTTWRIQAQILGDLQDEPNGNAMGYKMSVYNECTMISVAAAIVAQIAITGLFLDSLGQAHWTAKASFVLSLTFSLMAVYYATTQQRILGRILNAKDVRQWIRGAARQNEALRLAPNSISVGQNNDPDEYSPRLSPGTGVKTDIMRGSFVPSAASVITISAPQVLLSGSVAMLLAAFGVYFGFVWIRNLDPNVGSSGSRNVFITYITGLVVAGIVYNVSRLVQDTDKRSDLRIAEDNLITYTANNPQVVQNWQVEAQFGTGRDDFNLIPKISEMESSNERSGPLPLGYLDGAGGTVSNAV